MKLSERLNKIAKEENIMIGWCRAEIFTELTECLKNPVPFVKYSLEERINPFLTLNNAASIIAVGMSYKKSAEMPKDDAPRGAVSVGALGEDYHKVLMRKLERICGEALGGWDNMPFVDTGPMADRYIGYKCGLGFYGRHGNIINEENGSMFFIGYIITSAEMDAYMTPVDKKCAECRRCMELCPGGAISENGFDYRKCVSYITQLKGELTGEQKKAMGIWIYGCDVCQRACPYNRDFEPADGNEAYPDINSILTMTNKQFKDRFGNTAAGWRGKSIIQRNARIVLENITYPEQMRACSRFATDKLPTRSAAKWR